MYKGLIYVEGQVLLGGQPQAIDRTVTLLQEANISLVTEAKPVPLTKGEVSQLYMISSKNFGRSCNVHCQQYSPAIPPGRVCLIPTTTRALPAGMAVAALGRKTVTGRKMVGGWGRHRLRYSPVNGLLVVTKSTC